MRTKLIGIVMLWCLGSLSGIHAQSFDKLWKQVEKAEKDDLPQTVLKLTDEIYRKGKREKNSPQMLKAAVWHTKYGKQLVPDSSYTDLEHLKQWACQTEQPMERAILYSLIAENTAEHVIGGLWAIQQRTEVKEKVPTDMREWTANIFVDSICRYVKESVVDPMLLLRTSSDAYMPLVEQEAMSRYYHHDMLHLLSMRGIGALKAALLIDKTEKTKESIRALYEKMLSAYKDADNKEGYVLTALELLRWEHSMVGQNISSSEVENSPYKLRLDTLRAKYKEVETCAEVYLTEANYLANHDRKVEALQLCEEAIRLYPDYRKLSSLKELREKILLPSLNVRMEKTAFPGQEIKLNASHKNIDGFTLQLYRDKKKVSEQLFSLARPNNYLEDDTTFVIKAPALGKYTIRIVPDARLEEPQEDNEFYVTRFKVLKLRLPMNRYQVLALDGQTGHPIPNAQVTLYGEDGEEVLKEMKTDDEGKAIFSWTADYRLLKVTKGNDVYMPKQSVYGGIFGLGDADEEKEEVILLTDRSLYRPGQTVHVKGIAYRQRLDSARVIPNRSYDLSLLDANRQEVAKQSLQTNEFGSFTADFTLPSACLNGDFLLETTKGSVSIRVEEYKRPTFNITFEQPDTDYRIGDTVRWKGKVQAYSGILLPGLSVKYTVERSRITWGRFIDWGTTRKLIASGEAVTTDDGTFAFPLCIEADSKDGDHKNISYRYNIEATVTNAAGETQSASYTLFAGERALQLNMSMENKECKDRPVEVVFQVRNLNGQPVDTEGTYSLFRAEGEDGAKAEVPALTGTFVSNKVLTLDWKNLPSGNYVWKMSVKNSRGKEETSEGDLLLYSANDRRPPVKTPLWVAEERVEFDAAHPAALHIGTSEKDAYVMVHVLGNDRMIESKYLLLTDTVVRFEYPYDDSYGAGLSANVCMVRDGAVLQQQVRMEKRIPKESLSMKWKVFRDRLRPGQTEEWQLTILSPHGKAADAEMLATMYDASLDKIWNSRPSFSLHYYRHLPHIYMMDNAAGNNYFNFWWNVKHPTNAASQWFDHIAKPIEKPVVFAADGWQSTGVLRKHHTLTGNVSTINVNQLRSVPMAVFEESIAETGSGLLPEASSDVRTHLAETAFFYPQLRTNEKGEIAFSFTVPESLTRWNFRSYAHTKQMLLGTLEDEVTVSKEFMLTPNLPRFVRVGDRTSIAASLSNMTGETQKGTVSMTLFDPMTEKVISIQKQEFTADAGQTIGVNFRFTVTDGHEVVGCRMTADNDGFSDGEQQLIPVLSDKERLTETLPMPVRGKETRTFSLDSLFNHHSKTATRRRLTVEFTGNPAWYAVQALPSLSLPVTGDAISWATAYYANSLASYILNSQPRIKAVFDNWKLQGGTQDAFLSNLQKNQEVKNILLAESAWVLEAQTEAQQKERIATLFELNNIRSNNATALTRLKDLQGFDGAWTWYKGMPGNRHVTAYIAEQNARLALLTGVKPTGAALQMQQKALGYLHKEALREYEAMRKQPKKDAKPASLSESALQYLYVIAISGEKVPDKNKEAYDYFLSKVTGLLSSSSMKTKATAAVVLFRAGRTEEAQKFIASLKEHLSKTDELGMFFAFHEHPSAWGNSRMRAHVSVMEALSLAGGNDETVEEMKLWLLKQKQTQQWDSPVSTADAVYALLMRGSDLLAGQGDARIHIAGEVLDASASGKSGAAGLGYVKRSFTEQKAVDARTVKVEKRSPGIAWGAVYAEYESPIRDVKQQGNELEVRKQLYVKRLVDNVAQLQPVTGSTVLRVGDKLVSRLTVRADRTMDFVQLKDQSGACLEPTSTVSGYRWDSGLGYYVDVKDASVRFFFDRLNKGVYVLEHSYYVSCTGVYESGLATLQCAYAPEYASHSASATITVE